jgi:hypothetical protein
MPAIDRPIPKKDGDVRVFAPPADSVHRRAESDDLPNPRFDPGVGSGVGMAAIGLIEDNQVSSRIRSHESLPVAERQSQQRRPPSNR